MGLQLLFSFGENHFFGVDDSQQAQLLHNN